MDAEKILSCLPCILKRAGAVDQLQHLAPVKDAQDIRQISIAGIGQFIERELPVRFTWTAAHEGQFAITRPIRVPLQEMLDLRRLAVFINAKKANIQIVARVFEIIRVAAEKSHLLLGREDQSHIIVTFVSI